MTFSHQRNKKLRKIAMTLTIIYLKDNVIKNERKLYLTIDDNLLDELFRIN